MCAVHKNDYMGIHTYVCVIQTNMIVDANTSARYVSAYFEHFISGSISNMMFVKTDIMRTLTHYFCFHITRAQPLIPIPSD